MIRAARKCETCPFKGVSEDYRKACAHIQPEDWPCHTRDLHGDQGIQCRGHWQAVAKYGGLIGPQADAHDLNSTRNLREEDHG